jgi:hypothetical protein
MSEQLTYNAEDRTARHALPYLYPSQAHKEVTHNEALSRIDILISPTVQGVASAPQGLDPQPGQCWLISAQPLEIWSGCAHHIACWTGSGWQIAQPFEGMQAFDQSRDAMQYFRAGAWHSYMAPLLPHGGATMDEEARASISAIIERLEQIGLWHPFE